MYHKKRQRKIILGHRPWDDPSGSKICVVFMSVTLKNSGLASYSKVSFQNFEIGPLSTLCKFVENHTSAHFYRILHV